MEDKQLLLKDLCAKLPYGVRINVVRSNVIEVATYINPLNEEIWVDDAGAYVDVEEVEPYLRPMSSMTEEEEKQFVQFHCTTLCPIIMNDCLTIDNEGKMIDWLNEHHFDYRGLIEKGLAIDSSGLNIY